MGSSRGGRKIKICFCSNAVGEVEFSIIEIVYPHSRRSKHFRNGGEWTLWEQSKPHRPAQAFEELFFAFRDLGFIDNNAGVVAGVNYWLKDMDFSRGDRVKEVDAYRKKLLEV